jgi:hypothetical protein
VRALRLELALAWSSVAYGIGGLEDHRLMLRALGSASAPGCGKHWLLDRNREGTRWEWEQWDGVDHLNTYGVPMDGPEPAIDADAREAMLADLGESNV